MTNIFVKTLLSIALFYQTNVHLDFVKWFIENKNKINFKYFRTPLIRLHGWVQLGRQNAALWH